MSRIDETFLQEALQLINDEEIKLGLFARHRLKSYAEDYSKKVKENPEQAKKILAKIRTAIEKVLKG